MKVYLLALLLACSDTAGPSARPSAQATLDAGVAAGPFDTGTTLRVAVPDGARAYVSLDPPSVRMLDAGSVRTSLDWDLAFEGFDVFTNSGVSGPGMGGAFGPLDVGVFAGERAPAVPFLSADKTGGAFLSWYAYQGAGAHVLWSRYHVFGVKDGARIWKVQILTYYGERDGALIAGLYKVRFAEVTRGAVQVPQEVLLDGTAGGAQAPSTAPSECLDLGSGTRLMLTAEAARSSSQWHLCFRRQTISVNGEQSGPRGVGAVDLDTALSETVEELQAKASDAVKSRFDAVTEADFQGKVFRGDSVQSAFGSAWVNRGDGLPAPAYAAWLTVAASGTRKFLVGFSAFEAATATSPGTLVIHIKSVKDSEQ